MTADQAILLCGGTGMLGGEIARRLVDRGIPFRALLRGVRPMLALVLHTMLVTDIVDTPARAEPLRALGIEPTPVSRYIRDAVAGTAG